jgi:transposase-like protein
LFFVINTILQKRDTLTEIKLANEQLEALSKHLIKLTCSYCSKPNTLSITLNRENRFKCEFCQQVNGVKMQFFATQITTPIEKVLIPSSDTNDTIAEFKTSRT